MDARSLVLWMGDHTSAILDEPGIDVAGTVAMRLSNGARNARALRTARNKLGLGVALDPEAWRNQCRPDHVLRRASFRECGYDVRELFGQERLDIDQRLSDSQIAAYATANMRAQVALDPTLFSCPAHISPTAAALENDIALAEAIIEIAERRGLREPRDGDQHRRRRGVYATLCVNVRDLNPDRIRELVRRYVMLDVDGYWVWAVGFEPSGIQAELMLRLILALQENSGRVACPGGLSNLWQAALARGVAAAIAGPDRSALDFKPDEAPPPPRDPTDEDEDGRLLPIYHGAVLSSFSFDKRGKAVMRATFARNACGCGAHSAGEPPRGRRQITIHNQWWRLKEARRACVGNATQATGRLGHRLPQVRAERTAVGLKGGLPLGWKRSVESWDQMPVGRGAAEGRAA